MSTLTSAAAGAAATATTTPLNSSESKASASSALSSLSSLLSSASSSLQTESGIASGEGVNTNPSYFKYIGIALAVMSGVLIGSSFVFKKKGLLASQRKYSTVAGEGYQYLKSPMWWSGMILMILGEVLNFGAYAFAPAILVTPFGALSVVLCAILSSIFLKESLTLFGKIGCFLCVIGSVIIALNGPSGHNGGSIKEFRHLFISPGFLVWTGVCIAASLGLIFFVAPKKGKQWMMVYIGICSLLGGLSVSTTSGLGSAIVLTIRGQNQLKEWFFYVLLVFVAVTLVSEVIYLNKALELSTILDAEVFNTAMVTPSYYVTFTTCSIVSTIILFQGLDAAPSTIITLVLGFFVICTGVVLLQLSKVDPEELEEKEGEVPGLDRSTTLLMRASRSMVSVRSEKEAGYRGASSTAIEDPGIDTIRGSAGLIGSIIRARSSRRIRASADEYNRLGHRHAGGDQSHDTSGSNSHSHDVGMHQLNSGRRGDVERYELHDGPMLSPALGGSRSNSRLGDGMLSPGSGKFALPKRGESMISFTSESLEPHGHHAVTSPTSGSFPQSPSTRQPSSSRGPTGGILSHSQPAAPFLNVISQGQAPPRPQGGRVLSNISEARSARSSHPYPQSVLDEYDEEKAVGGSGVRTSTKLAEEDEDEEDRKAPGGPDDSFASTTSTTRMNSGFYEDPFSTIPTHLLLNDDRAGGAGRPPASPTSPSGPRTKLQDLRHMFDPSSSSSASRQQQQQHPQASSPPKQYTTRAFPGSDHGEGHGRGGSSFLDKAMRRSKKNSGSKNDGAAARATSPGAAAGASARRSEEELLSPHLVNERWGRGQESSDEDEGDPTESPRRRGERGLNYGEDEDDDDDARRPSIRVVQ